jgi:hypothetical protein
MKPIPYPLRGEWLITEEGADLIMHVWRTAHTTGKAERIALALEARDGKPLENERNCVITERHRRHGRRRPADAQGRALQRYQRRDVLPVDQRRLDECARARRSASSSSARTAPAARPPASASAARRSRELIEAGWHVEGYVETQAASAMYWLLSQCSHITAHPTAQVGWIGAVRRLRDDSEQDEKAGVKVHELISKGAEKKRTLPMDESVIARFQSNTDDWGALFTAAVARGRGVTTAKVLKDFGGGFGMFAAAALDVGMIDDVANFEETIARLTGARTSTSTSSPAAARAHRGDTMAIEKLTAGGADSEWQCAGCNEMMGPSAKSYCAKCADDDGDEDDDEDEDEAKALGLEPKAPAAQRRERMIALVALEERVFAATETKTHAAAMGRLAAVVADVTELPTLRAQLAETRTADLKRDLRVTLERGLMGAPGKQPTLSLGKIQKEMATALRGDQKKAWRAAMEKVAADVEAAAKDPNEKDPKKKTVTGAQIIEAACSVAGLTADDVEAIREFVETSAPVAAANYVEPERNGNVESARSTTRPARSCRSTRRRRAPCSIATRRRRRPSSSAPSLPQLLRRVAASLSSTRRTHHDGSRSGDAAPRDFRCDFQLRPAEGLDDRVPERARSWSTRRAFCARRRPASAAPIASASSTRRTRSSIARTPPASPMASRCFRVQGRRASAS